MAHVKGIQLTLDATKLEEEKARRCEWYLNLYNSAKIID